MTIGDRIKKRRLELNMTQEELAKKAGYKSRSSIQKIESSRDLPVDKIEIIAKSLDVSPSYLMGWSNDLDFIINEPGTGESYMIEHLLNILSNKNSYILPAKNDDERIAIAVTKLVNEIVNNSLDTEDIEKLTDDVKYIGKKNGKKKDIIFVSNPANTKIPKSGIETIEKRSKKSKKNNGD